MRRFQSRRFIIYFSNFILMMFSFSQMSVFGDTCTNLPITSFIIRQQISRTAGVLISRPCPLDEKIRELLIGANINCVDEYLLWLKDSITYKKDIGGDYWAYPELTLERGWGDCEDFAFLNQAVLRVMGYEARALSLMRLGNCHAICVFLNGNEYAIIDNCRLITTQAKSMEELAQYLLTAYQAASLCALNLDSRTQEIIFKRKQMSICKK
ncbi:MAG: transglutaminase-like cysteine peptidase [Candidatus Omnitrophica bacterium]|nr:transglutaminase-like cysteine peptidase [Candidatus Omnitrophota bacterium]MBU1924902.1 transglutaminase-like cysteine peptidase [Candidatus Omnitrophota bacterium]